MLVLSHPSSIEILPRAAASMCRGTLRLGTPVFVPHLAGTRLRDVATAACHLRTLGLVPVPHVSARAVRSASELSEAVSILSRGGVDSVLLIGGSQSGSDGPFDSADSLLHAGELLQGGRCGGKGSWLRYVGFAGHPEGNSLAGLTARETAAGAAQRIIGARKLGLSPFVVTQLCFDFEPIAGWCRELSASLARAEAGTDPTEWAELPPVPVRMGVVGCCSLSTCLRYAAMCGVSSPASLASAVVRGGTFKALATASVLRSRYTPKHLLDDLDRHQQDQQDKPHGKAKIDGIHIYPFGALEETFEFLRTRQRNAALKQ
eukprot:NODE_2346_length_1224_cov_38.511489_g2140_i0.p1 GENE.NODE_2346_length_1224_cov_38.511489_g2140_i0~~NODE_2346_length_1224_cov_38.511489_g2140_i0.p1  ORF type:complete len:336 (+),score=40.10 NODE_2346_length_1224_cov_38.511489_g2140_i0:55-1008(+)